MELLGDQRQQADQRHRLQEEKRHPQQHGVHAS
jgi:hypothetical protein